MVKPLTTEELQAYVGRELILLIGYPGSGKSHITLSTALLATRMNSNCHCYFLDTEDGLLKIWKKRFPDLIPGDRVSYYLVPDVMDFVSTFAEIAPKLRPGDWLFMESLARLWENSQDKAHQIITPDTPTKSEYLVHRIAKAGTDKLSSPIPQPDFYWQIAKGYHNRGFIDRLTSIPCNIMLTTALDPARSREPKINTIVKKMLGLDVSPSGWARGSFYIDTAVLTTQEEDGFYAQILSKDRGYDEPGVTVRFKINEFLLDLRASRK